ncbi:hypothetical protein [Vibrio comitans]
MQDILIVSGAALLLVVVIFWDLFLFKKIHNQTLYRNMATKLKKLIDSKSHSSRK